MKFCTVYEPPQPAPDPLRRAEQLVFVREGFSWAAALFAPLWMLAHRMWLVLLAYALGVSALDLTLVAAEIDTQWVVLAHAALHFIIGFEAGGLRRWTLERKGWRVAGTVSGRTETECERRFFESWTAKAATPEPGQRGISPDPGSSGPEPDPAAPGSPAAQSA